VKAIETTAGADLVKTAESDAGARQLADVIYSSRRGYRVAHALVKAADAAGRSESQIDTMFAKLGLTRCSRSALGRALGHGLADEVDRHPRSSAAAGPLTGSVGLTPITSTPPLGAAAGHVPCSRLNATGRANLDAPSAPRASMQARPARSRRGSEARPPAQTVSGLDRYLRLAPTLRRAGQSVPL
jgi:hypothetical protein